VLVPRLRRVCLCRYGSRSATQATSQLGAKEISPSALLPFL